MNLFHILYKIIQYYATYTQLIQNQNKNMLANVDKEFQELKQFMDCLNEFDLNMNYTSTMTYYEKLEVFNILNQLNKEKLEEEKLYQELFEEYINYD